MMSEDRLDDLAAGAPQRARQRTGRQWRPRVFDNTGMTVFEITSVRHHHDRSLAAWRLVDPNGQVVFDGVSTARYVADGRLEDISGFFAAQPGTEGP